MADLVRARVGNTEKSVGRALAEKHDLEILDEDTHSPDGRLRPDTRRGGRLPKPKTTVAKAAAKRRRSPRPASTTPEADAKPTPDKAVTASADNPKEQDQ